MNSRVQSSPPLHEGRSPQPAAPQSPSTSAASRFLAPLRLSAAQKRTLIKAMVDQQIGDLPSCQLFTGAAEYELGTFHRYARLESVPAPAQETPPPALDLSALESAATRLLGSLEQGAGPEPASDASPEKPWTLARLRRLRCELYRLVKACDLPAEPKRPTLPLLATSAEPVADAGSTRRFVRSLARTFGECFDETPTLAPDGPFRRALELLTTATGVRLGSLDLSAASTVQRQG